MDSVGAEENFNDATLAWKKSIKGQLTRLNPSFFSESQNILYSIVMMRFGSPLQESRVLSHFFICRICMIGRIEKDESFIHIIINRRYLPSLCYVPAHKIPLMKDEEEYTL